MISVKSFLTRNVAKAVANPNCCHPVTGKICVSFPLNDYPLPFSNRVSARKTSRWLRPRVKNDQVFVRFNRTLWTVEARAIQARSSNGRSLRGFVAFNASSIICSW